MTIRSNLGQIRTKLMSSKSLLLSRTWTTVGHFQVKLRLEDWEVLISKKLQLLKIQSRSAGCHLVVIKLLPVINFILPMNQEKFSKLQSYSYDSRLVLNFLLGQFQRTQVIRIENLIKTRMLELSYWSQLSLHLQLKDSTGENDTSLDSIHQVN